MTTQIQAVNEAEASLKVNGKTFAWARRFLGQEMGQNAAQLYAFCRLLDDLADGDLPDGEKRLKAIYNSFQNPDIGKSPLDSALAEFLPFMQRLNLPIDAIIGLIDGLLMDQGDVALSHQDDLIRYGYHVAGTVGVLMCRILDCDDDEAAHHAIDLGIAMQLTNIARDVLEDAEMGRRYLPGQWCNGMTADDIVSAAKTHDEIGIQTVRAGIQRMLGLAESYYASGMAGLPYLPLRAHVAILIAARAYRQIGVQLLRQGCPWHHGRVVTTTARKAITSLVAMPQMRSRMAKGQFAHSRALHDGLEGLPHVHR